MTSAERWTLQDRHDPGAKPFPVVAMLERRFVAEMGDATVAALRRKFGLVSEERLPVVEAGQSGGVHKVVMGTDVDDESPLSSTEP